MCICSAELKAATLEVSKHGVTTAASASYHHKLSESQCCSGLICKFSHEYCSAMSGAVPNAKEIEENLFCLLTQPMISMFGTFYHSEKYFGSFTLHLNAHYSSYRAFYLLSLSATSAH